VKSPNANEVELILDARDQEAQSLMQSRDGVSNREIVELVTAAI
jgi:hypothetical protein